MRFVLTRDAERFASDATSFLAARPERNVLATVLVNAGRRAASAATPLFAAGFDARGEICAAALRTPPWPLLACELDDTAAAEALVELWIEHDREMPGVSAQPATARAIATAWTRRMGQVSRCSAHEAMHVLSEVGVPARPAAGALRAAAEADRELLVGWEREFVRDAGIALSGDPELAVSRRLAAGSQFVWEDGRPVSTLALSPPIDGTRRIGPVFTPAEHRRHGYASSAVAAACTIALDGGATRCMLLTDLANPTSNKIYAALGFRRFGDWEEHTFTARA